MPTRLYRVLLLVCWLANFTFLHGQERTGRNPDTAGVSEKIRGGHPRIVRTQGLSAGNIGGAVQDQAGNIWFITGGEGVYRYDGHSFVNFTEKDGLSSNYVSALLEVDPGKILFGTRAGICRYDGRTFAGLTANQDASKKPVTSLLKDKAGNLWFGTMNDGVYRYDGQTFTNFLNGENPAGSKPQLVLDILQDKAGDLWFCSWNGGGAWRYDGRSFENYRPSAEYYRSNEDGRNIAEVAPKIPDPQPGNYLTDDMIFSVTEDKAGNLWFATRDHGACRYDGKYFAAFGENEGFTSRGAYAIIEDKNGYLWFATDKDGVYRYDGTSCTRFAAADGLVNNSVFCILEDRDGNLWFGTRGFGLCRFDGKTFTVFSE